MSKTKQKVNELSAWGWLRLIFVVGLLFTGVLFVFAAIKNDPVVEQHALTADWNGCRTESGTTSIGAGFATTDVTLSTSITDTSQAFLLVDSAGPGSVTGGDDHNVSGFILNGTTLRFEREGTSGQAEVSYNLIECFNNEIDVQRGEITIASASVSNTAAVTSVDTSRTMVIVNSRTEDTGSDDFEANVTGEMSAATTVLVERNVTGSNTHVRYEVVEFASSAIDSFQTAEVVFGSGASTTDTITSVDTDRSWLYCSWGSTNDGLRQTVVGCDLTNSTTVTFHRHASSAYTNRMRYYVIEFPTNTVSVQRGSEFVTSGTCSEGSQCNNDITISAVSSVTKAFPFVTNTVNGTGNSFPRNRWIESMLNTTTIRSSNWRSSGSTADDNFKYWQVIEFPPEPIVEQAAYRWFGNDDSTDVGSPLAAQDASATLGGAVPFRLRMMLDPSGGTLRSSDFDFKLQFAVQSGSCDTSFTGETYIDVTGATDIAYLDNATPADGAALTTNVNDPSIGGQTTSAQTYEELNDFTNTSDVLVAEAGLWDFALTDNGAPNSTTYCFRAVTSTGGLLDTYSVIPEITTFSGNAAPTGAFNSATQKTDGTSFVDVSIEVDDAEDDDTRALVEFDTDAACDGPWTKATLSESEGAAADFDDTGGSPSVVNADTYQVGSTATRRIITSSGSNTVDFDWDAGADAPGVDATYCLRLTANDDTSDQSPKATLTVAIDNEDPTFAGASVSPSTGTIIEGEVATISIDMSGEAGLSVGSAGCTVNGRNMSGALSDNLDGTYTILYAALAGDADWAAGGLPLSCEFEDGSGNTTLVSAFTDGNTLAGDIASAGGGGGAQFECPFVKNQSFIINGGAEVTGTREVQLEFTHENATEVIFDDSTVFDDFRIEPAISPITYTLSEGEGLKTVYLQLRNNCHQGILLVDSIEYIPGADGPETEPQDEENVDTTPSDDGGDATDDDQPIVDAEDVHEDVGGFIVVMSRVEDFTPASDGFSTNLASTEQDFYAGGSLSFTSGVLEGQTRTILSYDASDRSLVVDPAFDGTPSNGDTFTIVKSTVDIVVPSLPDVIVTPPATPSAPVLPVPIAQIPLADVTVIDSLSSIDGELDAISMGAVRGTSQLSVLKANLNEASVEIIDTLSRAVSIDLSQSALEDLAGFSDRDIRSFIDVQRSVEDLRALSALSRRLIEQGGTTPLAEAYMTFGSVELKYLLANPLAEPQTFMISAFLPEEVRPEHIFASDGFDVTYASEADVYQAKADVEVDGGELVVRTIQMRDIWTFADEDVMRLSDDADDLFMVLSGTRYEPEATLLKAQIDDTVETVLSTQAESYTSPQEHILIYRQNRDRLAAARADLDRLESLGLRAQFGPFGGPSTLTLWLIALVILLIVLMSGAFILLWKRETEIMRMMMERSGKKKPIKKSKKSSKKKHHDFHGWPWKYWRISMLFLALVASFAAAYFFGAELDQMTVEEAVRSLAQS